MVVVESKLLANWHVCDRCGCREGALLSPEQRKCAHEWRKVSWFLQNDEAPAG